MAEFKSWRSFVDFDRMVKDEMRYIRTADMDSFLDAVQETAVKHFKVLGEGSSLWRAQLDCNWRTKDGDVVHTFHPGVVNSCPYEKDRMRPRHGHVTEGRVNPKGIPCLYLATDRATAIAEVRPWMGSYVSVALFNIRRELCLVNCVTGDPGRIYLEEPPAAEREEAVWIHIEKAFARPVGRTDDAIDYATTQIIAELFRECGYDGIEYRSSIQKDGRNVVLFNPDTAAPTKGWVYCVDEVSLKYHPEGKEVTYE